MRISNVLPVAGFLLCVVAIIVGLSAPWWVHPTPAAPVSVVVPDAAAAHNAERINDLKVRYELLEETYNAAKEAGDSETMSRAYHAQLEIIAELRVRHAR